MENPYRKQKCSMDQLPSINFSVNTYKKLIETYVKDKDKFAICLIDINNFKIYNHIFGYEYGDQLLLYIFRELEKYIEERGKVFRFGGDILMVLLWDIEDKKEVERIIKGFLVKFRGFYEFKGHKIIIKFKIGVAVYPEDSDEIEPLLRYADIALFYSKQNIEDEYKMFDFNMHKEVVMKEVVEMDIINSLADDEFILYYQPQIDLITGKTYAVEALIRWMHPLYGMLPPSLFINSIEENGMINDVGKWVIEEACRQLKKWHELGYNHIHVFINVSGKQLANKDFFYFVKNVLEETKIDPLFLCLEITEYSLSISEQYIVKNLVKLRNLGVKIYLDDFGMAYSSLDHLIHFPIDGIKIDRSFINGINSDHKKLIIIKKTIELADELGLDIIVEGVEEIEQLDCLKKLSCNKIQGYLFGKPMDPSEVTACF